ncbi:DUF1559 domain-containing protein [Gimesia aquarii]|uniref:DUF1559 domain-containing protein n=1 Tax=Gimesia aquarii TaxID=2527964 RepID=A0A517WUN9_9PLAN|nr:DUF1559 domain-containing protein [Gimesia aquarii]QDU08987.1 hypothetical protein V202x_23570 [Gimesia aquarii]
MMAWQRWVTVGIILCILLLVFALLMPAIYHGREAARRSTSKNNLKQIGLALHNYQEAYRCLPMGGGIREDDVAMNGWLTMIMPFTDASPDYNSLDLDEPWDSPANVEVFQRVRPVFLNPSVPELFTSTGFGLTHYLGNPNLFYQNSSVQFDQMQNGLAHTWMAGEVAGNYQPWSYPFNWRALGAKLCDGPDSYGCLPWSGGHLLFADGSVSFFSNKTSSKILKRFADAPPIATKEQIEAPSKIFQTGLYHWSRIDLQTNPQSRIKYFVNVLRNEAGAALVIRIFTYEKFELTEAEKKEPRALEFSLPELLLQIDSTTDIRKALESTSLFKTASPEQFQANVKTLKALQKQLQ